MKRIAVAAALAALFAAALSAQANLATVTGIVADDSGAVIPGATLEIENTGTNNVRRVSTGAEGVYTFANLAPGDYQLTAQSEGFRQYIQRGIVLQTGQSLRVDVTLQIGAVTESITVDAQLVTLNTENGTIKGDVIVQEEIQELPLAGRDFTDLAFFVPGVVPKAQGGQGSALNVNGARASNTNFYVDGFDNRSSRGAAAQARPNIDALQEFKMEVSGYSAEYGRMAGGVMNMALRSGTNEFHGNLNYFLRNDINDARGFFEANKNKLRQNQFAALLAGPIIKNKTFFLVSYEGMRRIQDQTRLTRVPTALEFGGDFSQSLTWDNKPLFLRDREASGACTAKNQKACFPNNVIPQSRMDPIGLAIQSYYPAANRIGSSSSAIGYNYLVQEPDEDNWNSYLFKLDHKLGENNLAARYLIRHNDTQNPFAGGSDLGVYGTNIDDDRMLGGIDYTHMISPTMLFELRAGVSRNAAYNEGFYPGQNIAAELGLPNLIPEGESQTLPARLDWPRILVDNFAQIGTGANQPVQYIVTDWQYGAKMTWVKNKHNIKFGFNTNFVQFNQPFYNNQRGTFRARGRRTGNPLADLQLGWLHVANRQLGFNRNYWRQRAIGAFFNDDWKANRKLTLNLGFRWEVNQAPWDKYDRMGVYDTERLKLVLASDANTPANYQDLLDRAGVREAVTTADALGLSRSVVKTDWINLSPRVGFAYRVSDQTVVRGGYGVFLAGDILNNLRNNLSNQFPFAVNQTFTGVNNDPDLVSLQDPFPTEREVFTGSTTANGFTMEPQQAYLQSWNFTVERQLPGGTSLEIDYRGSKGTHLQRRYDFNQPFRSLDSYVEGEGFARPIPEWNALNIFSTSANSIYNAFNASWRKRSRGGLFWRLNYSYSKSIDTASQANGQSQGGFAQALDSRNLGLDRARSDWDRGHIFTMVGNYRMPFGKGQRWGANWHPVAEAILGGWQLSGTAAAYTGSPMTIETTGAALNNGESVRPNRLYDGRVPADWQEGKKGADFPWYDIAAFEAVPGCLDGVCPTSTAGFTPFAFGNSGRNILDGPGLFSINVGLSKNFRVKEGQNLQLRLETFNMLNRTNFIIQDNMTFFNSPTAGLLSAVGGVGRGGGPRIWQYALKYRF